MFCFSPVRDCKWCNSLTGLGVKANQCEGNKRFLAEVQAVVINPRSDLSQMIFHYLTIFRKTFFFFSKVWYFIPHSKFEVIPDTSCTTRIGYRHGVTNTHAKLSRVLKDAGHSKGDCHHLVSASEWCFCGPLRRRVSYFFILSSQHRLEIKVCLELRRFKPCST